MIALDHLVVACSTLDAGRDWCEATFGVVPQPGGRHALMGTHNLLLALASDRFAKAYLELIAIDPEAQPPAQPRWFDLDDAKLQATIAARPRLVHWVGRCDDIDATVAAVRAAGYDPGRIADADRMTARGLLRWRITLPVDGRRPGHGALPLWVQWFDVHPTDTLPPSGVRVESLQIGNVAAELGAYLGTVAESGASPVPLRATLMGPRGRVVLMVSTPARLSA